MSLLVMATTKHGAKRGYQRAEEAYAPAFGRAIVKVEPPSGLDSTSKRPPEASMTWRAMKRESPRPPTRRVDDESPWVNGLFSNVFSVAASSPGPWSRTISRAIRDLDLDLALGKGQSILHERYRGLANAVLIAGDLDIGSSDRDPVRIGFVIEHRESLAGYRAEREVGGLKTEPPALDPADGQNLVDHQRQSFALSWHGLEKLELRRFVEFLPLVLEGRDSTTDCRERRTQFVRNDRDELGLHSVEIREGARSFLLLAVQLREVLHDASRNLPAESGFAGMNRIEWAKEFLGAAPLEEVAVGTGFHHLTDEFHLAESGKGENLDFGVFQLDDRGRFGPRHLRHTHVHDDDIGIQAPDLADGLAPVRALTHYLDVLLEVQQLAQSAAHVDIVIDNENSHIWTLSTWIT
jgi:hypothetical protein